MTKLLQLTRKQFQKNEWEHFDLYPPLPPPLDAMLELQEADLPSARVARLGFASDSARSQQDGVLEAVQNDTLVAVATMGARSAAH